MRRHAASALMLCLLWHFAAPLTAVAAAPPAGAPGQIEMPRATSPRDWLPRAAASETLARPLQADAVRLPLAAWCPPVALCTPQRAGAPLLARAHRAHYPPRRMLRCRARAGDDRPA